MFHFNCKMSRKSSRATFVALMLSALLLFLSACGSAPTPNNNTGNADTPGQTDGNGQQQPAENNENNDNQDKKDLPELRVVEESEIDGSLKTFVEANIPYPGIRFFTDNDEVYILVSLGEKPTGGYGVEVTEIEELSQEPYYQLVVNITEPKKDETVTQALTYPYQVVALKARGEQFSVRYTGDVDEDHPLSGEGIVGPNLILESPEPGATIGESLQLKGKARVFEATFEVVLEDGHNELFRGPIMADKGAPDWGSFNEEIKFDPTTQQNGILILTEYSMRDGEPVEMVITPVRFGK